MGINNGIGRVWAANAGDEGRPAGVGPVWIENIDAITPSGSGGSTYTGGNGIDVDNDNDIISLDDEAQAAIDSYVTNSGSFVTSADVPVIGFENDGILDTDYDGIKITNDSVGNEHVNLKKGESWYNHGLLVPTSPGNDKYLTTTSAGHLSWENQPEIPEVPEIKDLVAGNGIDISATSADVTISVDNSVFNGYATETWTAQNYFPIDGLQIVGSSAEASGANIIYIVSGSNA
jgi:hypothetical protein